MKAEAMMIVQEDEELVFSSGAKRNLEKVNDNDESPGNTIRRKLQKIEVEQSESESEDEDQNAEKTAMDQNDLDFQETYGFASTFFDYDKENGVDPVVESIKKIYSNPYKKAMALLSLSGTKKVD